MIQQTKSTYLVYFRLQLFSPPDALFIVSYGQITINVNYIKHFRISDHHSGVLFTEPPPSWTGQVNIILSNG